MGINIPSESFDFKGFYRIFIAILNNVAMKKFPSFLVATVFLIMGGSVSLWGQSSRKTEAGPPDHVAVAIDQQRVPVCTESEDQVNVGTSNYYVCIGGSQAVAQTFVAGVKGHLVKVTVDLSIGSCSLLSGFYMTAEILDGAGWNGTVLATQPLFFTLPLNRCMFPIVFSSPASLLPGHAYTLKLTVPAGQICEDMDFPTEAMANWHVSAADSYLAGNPMVNGTDYTYYDHYFITTINPNSSTLLEVDACKNYYWSVSGLTYYASGLHYAAYTNSAGCDSIVTLDLTINNVDAGITQVTAYTLQANAEGAAYRWLNCLDNYAVIPGAVDRSFFPGIDGEYAVEVTQNGCVDTSVCMPITAFGIPEMTLGSVNVFPNPARGIITLELQGAEKNLQVQVYDNCGRLLLERLENTNGVLRVETGLAPGLRLVRLMAEDGRSALLRVMIE